MYASQRAVARGGRESVSADLAWSQHLLRSPWRPFYEKPVIRGVMVPAAGRDDPSTQGRKPADPLIRAR